MRPGRPLSRRTALAAAGGLAFGLSGSRSRAQTTAGSSRPLTVSDWRDMGVSLDGAVALVTGSTDGLGAEVARQLGALGAFVLVHGRNVARGEALVEHIRATGPGDAALHRADLASLAEVRQLADSLLDRYDRLDVLINNAAARGRAERSFSADGHELAFAVNYLAHFLLTHLLLPLLDAAAPSRIVNVSSLGQAPIDLDDLNLDDGYTPGDAYRRSKLAQVMFTMDLAGRLDPGRITVTAVHPARSMNTPRVIDGGFEPLSTVEEGAQAVMQLAVSPQVEGLTGAYYNRMFEARPHDQAYDPAVRARLWEISTELAGL